jgi:hypothetical protein
MPSRDEMLAAYDRLLAAIGARATDLGDGDLATHGPHVGSAYRGLVILGQAPYGWSDVWPPSHFATADGRQRVLAATMARNADRAEPLEWIETSHHRTSPWWSFVRTLTQLLEPDAEAPWYGRFAWVNLYPVARDIPPGNPSGLLRKLEDPLVGELLAKTLDALEAKTVVATVGPMWWPTGSSGRFASLVERPRPLMASGRTEGRTWVVGWHPSGASHRGVGPYAYARLIADEVAANR